jgi:hypothetical protein
MSNHEFTNWVALPNGIVEDVVRLSVFVNPKLLGEAGTLTKLSNYEAILNWPATIRNLQLKVDAQVGAGIVTSVTLRPSNRGELALDPTLWPILFSADTRVEPIAPEAAPAAKAAARRSLPVFYRSAPLQAIVEETYAIQARMALSDLENEPARPKLQATGQLFDLPDRLLSLAGGADAALSPNQFPVQEGKTFQYRPAEAVTRFFSDARLAADNGAFAKAIDSPLTNSEIRDLFTGFSLYHKRGVRNRLRQIRARRRWTNTDPDFNFLDTDSLEIDPGDHGKEFEFAESAIDILLPALTEADRGFEVVIAYSPNEALPAMSNDLDADQAKLRAEDESKKRYEKYLVVRARDSNSFVDGALSTHVEARRSKRISWNGSRWAELDPNDIDFQATLSGLCSYPALLRRLGWVFDLELPTKDLFPRYSVGQQFDGRVRVVPVWDASVADPPASSSPWTLFSVGERSGDTAHGLRISSFSARPDPNRSMEQVSAGFRDLTPVGAFQYDLDAAMIKTVQKAIRDADQTDTYAPAGRNEIPGSPRAAVLNGSKDVDIALAEAIDIDPQYRAAAIRSTGLSLYGDREYQNFARALSADASRADKFFERLDQALKATAAVQLSSVEVDDVYLNDLVAGYVIDVMDSAEARWRSLCERQVVFRFKSANRLAYLAPVDEGWVSAEALVEVDEDGTKQLRISENLFRWDGWSLVVRNPSTALKDCQPFGSSPLQNIDLTTEVEIKPLSLAKLRFGRTYRFRARLADIGGNVWHIDYANGLNTDDLASPSFTYRRSDPINPPNLVPLQPPGPGTPPRKTEQENAPKGPEKGEMLVIRSGLGGTAASGEWLVLPPEVKFQEAEWMGMFDAFDTPDKLYEVLSRYCDALPDQYDPTFLSRIAWEGRLGTPYLPDGYAAKAAFQYLPGGTERQTNGASAVEQKARAAVQTTVTLGDFAVDFEGPAKRRRPFAQPFRLRLTSGKTRRPAAYSSSNRRLTVTLPPGEQQLIRVSSAPRRVPSQGSRTEPSISDEWAAYAQVYNAFEVKQEKFIVQPRDSATLGKADWGGIEAHRTLLTDAIEVGQFWPLTPQKNLYLVHAVPKPLVPPSVDPPHEPKFKFSQNMKVTPRVTGGKAVVLADPTLRVHRTSTGRIDVYAEWDEHFDSPSASEFPRKERRSHLCFSSDIDLPDLTIAPDETHLTLDFGRRHEFPTTKHYAVRYHMVATTRYREYYSTEFTAKPENITIRSDESAIIHILNTVPPPVPQIVYVLPILVVEEPIIRKTAHKTERIERTVRRGLRVYMRRDWWASGEDEQLGVVFSSKNAKKEAALEADPDNQIPVTQWGTNPIWHTTPIKRQPTIADARTVSGMRFADVAIAKKGISAAQAERRDKLAAQAKAHRPPPLSPMQKTREQDAQVEPHPDDVAHVDVAAFTVHVDHNKGLIYADVEFNEPDSYSPLVKMALARFQPHSSPYAHLSAVTSWVFQTLSPERTIAYGPSSEQVGTALRKQVTFAVSGKGPGDTQNGFPTNSLEVLLYDGNAPASEQQLPLVIDDFATQFVVPVDMLKTLKKPSLQIKEFEQIGTGTRRLVLSWQVAIDDTVWK